MRPTRRQLIGGAAAATLLSPVSGLVGNAFGAAAVDPATAKRRRLVVIFQSGGNDGLNTVVPMADVSGAARRSVYEKVRPTLALSPSSLLALNRRGDTEHELGLHPSLATMSALYTSGRVAVVQGVDYPAHDYSHFRSTDIWQSGEPGRSPSTGWIGRHLDRAGVGEGELRGAAVGGIEPPLILRGSRRQGAGIVSIAATRFGDGKAPVASARHDGLARYGTHPSAEILASYAGRQDRATVRIVRALGATAPPPVTQSRFADAMLTARTLLEEDLGVECVFVEQPGYDTHTNQLNAHAQRLADLDGGIEAFLYGRYRGTDLKVGALNPRVANHTLIVTFSEFGRRIGEAGVGAAAGTDHGAAAPLFVIGPAAPSGPGRLVAGIHGDHPGMGTTTLPADNLAMTTDLRRIYAAVMEHWLRDPDPLYTRGSAPLPGLFSS
ncbi:MAG TPA: DUF1501 domain-containing protein [Mycobacteriales bacterium]|nr:DUF1501 domain-containing protein [Mycobacteriales bacterium]